MSTESYRTHADRLAALVSEVSSALQAPKGSFAEAWKERATKAITGLRTQQLADRQGNLLARTEGQARDPETLTSELVDAVDLVLSRWPPVEAHDTRFIDTMRRALRRVIDDASVDPQATDSPAVPTEEAEG